MKKVLIITYYWPPLGGSGVQRWLKMSRYLRDYGWEPVIYTPENPSFGIIDESLEKDVPSDMEVIRMPIQEPYQLFNRLKGKRGIVSASDIALKQNKGWIDKFSLWIRSNLFIPDPRMFWISPSVKLLPEIIRLNGIEAVITTGPPHSLHLIGRKLKKRLGIKWFADFRDPWTEWDLYQTLPMLSMVRKRHYYLEKKVLQEADEVLTVNESYKRSFNNLANREIQVITNGYDDEDFKNFNKQATPVFTIRYVGIVDEMRDPIPFFQSIKQLRNEYPDVQLSIEFIGVVTEKIKEYVLINNLSGIVKFLNYKPHHEIIHQYQETDLLLLILTNSKEAKANTPGKVYEYLAAQTFILCIGPEESVISQLLEKTKAGLVVDPKNISKIKMLILRKIQDYQNGNVEKPAFNLMNYSRRGQAEKVAALLDFHTTLHDPDSQ